MSYTIVAHFDKLCSKYHISSSYCALSVRYGANTARVRGREAPEGECCVCSISHTKRTIAIIFSVTMAP